VRAQVVVNPNSRRGTELGHLVAAELEAHGVAVANGAGAEIDAIVVAGGDGTFVGQIGRALRRGIPMGLIPLGTFNDLARTLAIPLDVHRACAIVAAGCTRPIDVARVNGSYYVNEASIGISSRIARLQQPADKRRFGFFAIAASWLQAFAHARPIRVQVEFDGRCERFKTIQLTVANSNRFGGFVEVAGASIDDGWLDLYAVEIRGLFGAFPLARALLGGGTLDMPGLRRFRSRAFEVYTRHPHGIAADGEPAGKTPARFEVLPKALRVFVPE